MSEIYKNSTEYVYLDIYGGTVDDVPTATCVNASGVTRALDVTQEPDPAGAEQRFSAVVGLADTQEAGVVKVTWTFAMGGQSVTKTDYLDVVVPLVSVGEVRQVLDVDSDEVTDEEILNTERRVRKIIESYTGQEFLIRNDIVTVVGNGSKVLKLPKRAVEIASVNGMAVANENLLKISNDGWGLTRLYPAYPTGIKAGGWPISHPYPPSGYAWENNFHWVVEGKFGWERVPTDIKEAAYVLMEQELCSDSAYRNRYIETMTAADWRIEFLPPAYKRTGNVVADQILAKFVVSTAAVF